MTAAEGARLRTVREADLPAPHLADQRNRSRGRPSMLPLRSEPPFRQGVHGDRLPGDTRGRFITRPRAATGTNTNVNHDGFGAIPGCLMPREIRV